MRIRTVKPEFWSHPVMARLGDDVQLLALALLCHADDEGYFMADPAIVRGACMPFRESLATISRSLAKLSEAGWIEVCDSEKHGQIGHIVNWEKHQKVDHARHSKIKVYFSRENFAKPRESLAPDQGTGNREQGTGNTDGAAHASRSRKPKPEPIDPDTASIPPHLQKYADDLRNFAHFRAEDKREPFTARSWAAFLKTVSDADRERYLIPPLIAKAIGAGWKTLYVRPGDPQRPETDEDRGLQVLKQVGS